MKSYEQIAQEIGYDIHAEAPKLKYQWVFYDGGVVFPAASMNDAMSKSSLYDRVISKESIDEQNAFIARQCELRDKTVEAWKAEMRVEYMYIPDSIFGVCLDDGFAWLYHVDTTQANEIDEMNRWAHRVHSNVTLYESFKRVEKN